MVSLLKFDRKTQAVGSIWRPWTPSFGGRPAVRAVAPPDSLYWCVCQSSADAEVQECRRQEFNLSVKREFHKERGHLLQKRQ